MSTKRKSCKMILCAILTLGLVCTGVVFSFGERGHFVNVKMQSKDVFAAVDNATSLSDMPADFYDTIVWCWNNRIQKEHSVDRKNLLFDQIVAGNGTLNYVVKWQSTKRITLEQRKKMETFLGRQINNWNQYLYGYDGWPYEKISVKIVGWAVKNESILIDRQPDEIVYTTCTTDPLHSESASIPEFLPYAPSELSRFDHFTNKSYSYPGGLDKRFDMYLWATTGFLGGCGGDWGQRMSEDYILDNLDTDQAMINEHELGHGFGVTDFYGDDERPPQGFPMNILMWGGHGQTITEWDAWMVRYIWSQIKQDTTRFPESMYTKAQNNQNNEKQTEIETTQNQETQAETECPTCNNVTNDYANYDNGGCENNNGNYDNIINDSRERSNSPFSWLINLFKKFFWRN